MFLANGAFVHHDIVIGSTTGGRILQIAEQKAGANDGVGSNGNPLAFKEPDAIHDVEIEFLGEICDDAFG